MQLCVIEDGALMEMLVDAEDSGSLLGNIYMGRVDHVLSGMDAAFVDIGAEHNGMLSLTDVSAPNADGEKAQPKPRALRPGMEILVQVFKQPGGGKGPRLTQNYALPGRMAVLTPTMDQVSISKKIESAPERDRLKSLARSSCPEGMGLIVRTAADGADDAALRADVSALVDTWREIERVAPHRKAPSLLYQSPSLLHLALRDFMGANVSRLVIEGEDMMGEAQSLASADQLPRIISHHSDIPLFALHRVGAQLEKARHRQVWLPSGGGITIDPTEALTVIDVNSGKFVGSGSLEQTLFQTNCEAAVELCRQLRLRDIGGIVIVDFIDMAEEDHRCGLLNLLENELGKDRMKTNLLGMTKLGLVELTRKKDQSSMLGARATCKVCNGTGRVERKKEPK